MERDKQETIVVCASGTAEETSCCNGGINTTCFSCGEPIHYSDPHNPDYKYACLACAAKQDSIAIDITEETLSTVLRIKGVPDTPRNRALLKEWGIRKAKEKMASTRSVWDQ